MQWAGAALQLLQTPTRILQILPSCSGRMTMWVTPWCRWSATWPPCRHRRSRSAPMTTSCTCAGASEAGSAPCVPAVGPGPDPVGPARPGRAFRGLVFTDEVPVTAVEAEPWAVEGGAVLTVVLVAMELVTLPDADPQGASLLSA